MIYYELELSTYELTGASMSVSLIHSDIQDFAGFINKKNCKGKKIFFVFTGRQSKLLRKPCLIKVFGLITALFGKMQLISAED
jgi:hypothetical protein